MRKVNVAVIWGFVAGLAVLAAWLLLIVKVGSWPHGFFALRLLASAVLISAFLAGFRVYEYFEERKPRTLSLTDDLQMKTGTRLGAPNESIRCPNCDAPMVKRLAKRGRAKGHIFFGCSNFPRCMATRSIENAIWHPHS